MPGGYNALMAYPPRDAEPVEDNLNALWNGNVVPGTRGTVFPAAQYDDGKYHLAWPGLVAQPFESFNAMSPENSVEDNSRLAFDAAGGAMTGGLAAGMAGAVPEGAVAANGIGARIRGLFGKGEPEVPPYDFGERHGPPMRYGSGEYQLEQRLQPPAFDGINSRDFSILKSGEPIGKASTVVNGPSAFVDTISVDGGSNALGLRGIRDLREAYREAAPSVTNFRGERVFGMKTTDAKPSGSGRSQSVDLYSNSPTGSSVPLAVNAMERKPGFTAYHGSPHDFDKFDLSKIGTGEGAQAYGHGLYFAENEGVAKSYRERLSGLYDSAEAARDQITKALGYTGQTRLEPQMMMGGRGGFAVFAVDDPGGGIFRRKPKERFIGSIQEPSPGRFYPHSDDAKVRGDGHMYEVNINADPEQFLDWDKPLAQQSEHVQNAMRPFLENRIEYVPNGPWTNVHLDGKLIGTVPKAPDAMNAPIDHAMSDVFARGFMDRSPEFSAKLREAGVPGVRYWDGASRAAGDGSRNYVLFDDSLVDINRKYANHPFGASAPLAFNDSENQPQNALMPSLSKKEKDHHSLTQPRTASGQFTR